MLNYKKPVIFATCALIGGCATTPPAPTALVPVTHFVNSLKCEFATFLSTYKGKRLNLSDWGVSGSLALNVATSSSMGGGVAVSGLVPFQGASADLGFKAGVSRKYTTNTNLDFELTSSAASASICQVAGDLLVDGGIGFGTWLTSLANDLDRAAAGDPKFAVSGLDYELIFAVESSAGVNGSLTIVPLTISAEALASRNDVQTMKINLDPPQKTVGYKKDGTPIRQPVLQPFGTERPRSYSPLVLPRS
ncbi:hypothetical protein ACETIH_28560 [Microvirga arabica]|uniref:Uncharacterized protein n=1 Tax=Microvirga arabica TaxID=1128671 RepID=A0ABV6YH44_9HYPH